MIAYLQRLLNERDQLTAHAEQISDAATKRNEDLTDTEKVTLDGIQKRCAEIDSQVSLYNDQAESTRRYADLRSRIHVIEDRAETERMERAERAAANGHANGAAVEVRDPGGVETADTSWAAPFMRSGVLQNYTGHGTTSKIDIGPAWDYRQGTGTITTQTPPDGVIRPQRWTGNATPTWTPRLLSLVNTVPTTAGAVDWVRYQPHPPSAAQVVPEGQAKPEMQLTLEIE